MTQGLSLALVLSYKVWAVEHLWASASCSCSSTAAIIAESAGVLLHVCAYTWAEDAAGAVLPCTTWYSSCILTLLKSCMCDVSTP